MFAQNAAAARSHSPDGEYHLWTPPGHAIAIHLSFSVIDALNRLVADASARLARPGPEIGGILLGRTETGDVLNVWIDDFETLTRSSSDLAWRLTAAEQIALQRKIARRVTAGGAVQVAGFYRTQTRHGLSLTEDDCALCAACFPDPANVFLLIKPGAHRPNTGAFFFWEGSGITRSASYLEFPFVRPAPEAAPIEPVPAPSEIEPAATRKSPSGWLGWCVAGAFALAGIWGLAHNLKREPGRRRDPAPPTLGLAASEQSDLVSVRWDRQSPVIAAAQRGILSVRNGVFQRSIELPADQLRNGSLIYGRLPAEAEIKLEVFTNPATSVSEVLRLAATAAEIPAATEAPPPTAPPERMARVRHRRGRRHSGHARVRAVRSMGRRPVSGSSGT